MKYTEFYDTELYRNRFNNSFNNMCYCLYNDDNN